MLQRGRGKKRKEGREGGRKRGKERERERVNLGQFGYFVTYSQLARCWARLGALSFRMSFRTRCRNNYTQ